MSAAASANIDLTAKVEQYLAERLRLGFKPCSSDLAVRSFTRFMVGEGRDIALTVDVMVQWAHQVQPRYLVGGRANVDTAARRLATLRPFMRWLQQFDPTVEVPDDSSFGPIPRRVAPHIYSEAEIAALIVAARRLGPSDARVSEAIGVKVGDVVLAPAACVHLHGKGRKQRSVPLWRSTVKVIRAWLKFNPDLTPTSALLPNRGGQAMTRSNVTQRLALAVKKAALTTPSLAGRTISPHCLRHSTAMHLLQSGVDISVIALWLGHESPATTHQYIEADLAMKEKALARLQDPNVVPQRFRAEDDLLKFLKTL